LSKAQLPDRHRAADPSPCLFPGPQSPDPITGKALIDTGASRCAIDEEIVRSLSIPPFGLTSFHTPSGVSHQLTDSASLSFPGITAIIGRNVIRSFVFIYNGPGGSVSLAY
jgi:hypothetical protein